MKCNNCGTYIENNDKFCKNCGERTNNDHANQFNYSYNYSNTTTPSYNMNADHKEQFNYSYAYTNNNNYTTSGDDIYIKEYVGPNYEKIKNLKFSLPTFFLGAYYLLYRKVWGYAILYIVISLVCNFILDESIGSIITLGLNIILCLKFSSIYMKKANNGVEKIKQENLDKTTQELLALCRKKGGTSVLAPILTAIGIFVVTFIAALVFLTSEIVNISDFTNEEEEIIEVDNQVQNLTFTIPEGFEVSFSSGNYRSFRYTDPNSYTSCYFTIDSNTFTSLYPTEEKYLETHVTTIDENEKITAITPITFNNTEWKYMHLESPKRSETQYAVIVDERIYIVKTYDYKYETSTNQVCNTKYNELLNSLTIKKTNNSL